MIDHGCGIPPAFRKQLFERFSQADTSDGRSRGGTGLGMAIAKHLTEQMSGRISFESEENVGTTFHLEFPLADAEATAATTSTLAAACRRNSIVRCQAKSDPLRVNLMRRADQAGIEAKREMLAIPRCLRKNRNRRVNRRSRIGGPATKPRRAT